MKAFTGYSYIPFCANPKAVVLLQTPLRKSAKASAGIPSVVLMTNDITVGEAASLQGVGLATEPLYPTLAAVPYPGPSGQKVKHN